MAGDKEKDCLSSIRAGQDIKTYPCRKGTGYKDIRAREFMGELSLFVQKPQTDNAEALQDTTICVIDGEN